MLARRHQGPQSTGRMRHSVARGAAAYSETGVILPPMQSDEPAWLAYVLLRYLDEDWVELAVHREIGEAVGNLYKESRAAGDDDLLTVMAPLAFGLKAIWHKAGFE